MRLSSSEEGLEENQILDHSVSKWVRADFNNVHHFFLTVWFLRQLQKDAAFSDPQEDFPPVHPPEDEPENEKN